MRVVCADGVIHTRNELIWRENPAGFPCEATDMRLYYPLTKARLINPGGNLYDWTVEGFRRAYDFIRETELGT